jgi:hypothetical protein
MRRRLLIACALFVGAVAAFLVLNLESTVLSVAIILANLRNPGPPPIAEGQINGNNSREVSRKLTAVLERRFPNGTPESELKSVLLEQGFYSLPPRPAFCPPYGQAAPNPTCLSADEDEKRKRTLNYKWSDGVCSHSVSIVWSADVRGEITDVQGNYSVGCL